MTSCEETPTTKDVNSYASAAVSVSGNEASTPNANNLSLSAQETVSSPVSVTPAANPELAVASELSSIQEDTANLASDETELHAPSEIAASVVVSDTPVQTAVANAMTSPTYHMFPFDYVYPVFLLGHNHGLLSMLFQGSLQYVTSGSCTFFCKNFYWECRGNFVASVLSQLLFPFSL